AWRLPADSPGDCNATLNKCPYLCVHYDLIRPMSVCPDSNPSCKAYQMTYTPLPTRAPAITNSVAMSRHNKTSSNILLWTCLIVLLLLCLSGLAYIGSWYLFTDQESEDSENSQQDFEKEGKRRRITSREPEAPSSDTSEVKSASKWSPKEPPCSPLSMTYQTNKQVK